MTDPIVSPNQDSDNLKKCTKCGVEKPATTEYFRAGKRAKSGLNARCRVCEAAQSRRYYQANRDKARESQRKYYHANVGRLREANRRWQQNNPDKVRERNLQWRQRNPEKIIENNRRGYQNNRERSLESTRRWRRENPDRSRANARAAYHRRRARERQAKGTHAATDVQAQYDSQRGKCWWCGKKIKEGKYHVDHRIPLARGGSNAPENLVIACPECNLSKNDKLPHEWCDRLL